MTVSFVNAGLLTLAQAISVIMGANIGTTFTAWIMSLGYNVDLTIVVFPAFFLGIMLIYSKKRRYFGDFLFGIAFLFFSLVLLSSAGKALDLEHNPAVIDFFGSFDTKSHFTIVTWRLAPILLPRILFRASAFRRLIITWRTAPAKWHSRVPDWHVSNAISFLHLINHASLQEMWDQPTRLAP